MSDLLNFLFWNDVGKVKPVSLLIRELGATSGNSNFRHLEALDPLLNRGGDF